MRLTPTAGWSLHHFLPLLYLLCESRCKLFPPPHRNFGESLGEILAGWLERSNADFGTRAVAAILPSAYLSSPIWSSGALAVLHRRAHVTVGVSRALPLHQTPPGARSLALRYEVILYVTWETFKETVSRLRFLPYWNALSRVYVVLPEPLSLDKIHSMFVLCVAYASVLSPLFFVPNEKGSFIVYNYYLQVNSQGYPEVHIIEEESPLHYQCFFCEIQDFKRYPINITMFKTIPDAIPSNESNGKLTYWGSDGLMMQTIVKKLNAKPIIIHPEGDQTYGVRMKNGTYTGAAADLAYRHADIGFNARYLKPEWRDEMEFTYPHARGNLVVVVPKALEVPLFLHLFLPFTLLTWVLLLITIPVAALIWWGVWNAEDRVLGTQINLRKGSLRHVNFLTAASFLSVNVSIPKARAVRFFFAFWIIFSLIITSTFQGSLVSYLAVPKFLPDINTLEELDRSGKNILVYPSVVDLINRYKENNSILSRLQKKFIVYYNIYDLPEQVLYHQNISAIMDENSAKYRVREYTFATEEDQPRLHIVAERPIHGFFAYALPRFSPFLPRITSLVAAITEAGLYAKWRSDMFHAGVLLGHLLPELPLGPPPPRPLKTPHVQTAFYILLLGLLLAGVVFVIEVRLGGYRSRKYRPVAAKRRIYMNEVLKIHLNRRVKQRILIQYSRSKLTAVLPFQH